MTEEPKKTTNETHLNIFMLLVIYLNDKDCDDENEDVD